MKKYTYIQKTYREYLVFHFFIFYSFCLISNYLLETCNIKKSLLPHQNHQNLDPLIWLVPKEKISNLAKKKIKNDKNNFNKFTHLLFPEAC